MKFLMRIIWILPTLLVSLAQTGCRSRLGAGQTQLHAESRSAEELGKAVKTLLAARCADCHAGGADEGGFDFVDQIDVLVARGLVVPGNPNGSKLAVRINSNEMPPPDSGDPLTAEEKKLVLDWIQALADPAKTKTLTERDVLSMDEQFDLMLQDIENVEAQDRPFVRYFSNTHLWNARFSDGKPVYNEQEIQVHRDGLVKFLNSISRQPLAVVVPVAGSNLTIFRVDLRDFGLDVQKWQSIKQQDDYEANLQSASAQRLRGLVNDSRPVMRGDWFIFAASVPPLYDHLLGLPTTLDGLIQQLFGPSYSLSEALRSGRVVRAGFNESGVSSNNRIIDRHPYPLNNGGLWISYDFGSNLDRKNIFQFPLGPREAFQDGFDHDGGEIIFSLPNGLHGYMLVDGRGQSIVRVDETAIVKDPAQRDGKVINGRSCMRCHSQGMIYKDDQVYEKFSSGSPFARVDLNAFASLYQPKKMREVLAADRTAFMAVIEKLGINPQAPDPVHAVVRHFEATLFLEKAAGEVGVTPEVLRRIVRNDQELFDAMGNILAPGGIVQRDVFRRFFRRISDLAYPQVPPGLGSAPTVPAPHLPSVKPPAVAGTTDVKIRCQITVIDLRTSGIFGQPVVAEESFKTSKDLTERRQLELRVQAKARALCEQRIRGLNRFKCGDQVACTTTH